MRFPAPIVALTWRVHDSNRVLRGSNRDLAAENRRLRADLDAARAEACVSKQREKRWRKAAEMMTARCPDMQWMVTRFALSDDIADLPEIEDHQRNAFPRSLP